MLYIFTRIATCSVNTISRKFPKRASALAIRTLCKKAVIRNHNSPLFTERKFGRHNDDEQGIVHRQKVFVNLDISSNLQQRIILLPNPLHLRGPQTESAIDISYQIIQGNTNMVRGEYHPFPHHTSPHFRLKKLFWGRYEEEIRSKHCNPPPLHSWGNKAFLLM